jgi:hypothetical protein
MSVNIRAGKKGTAVHLGLWDRDGSTITRRACRRRNFSNSARFRPTTDPVTCKTCIRLRDDAPAWLVKAAYGNDPSFSSLADGLHVELPTDVPLAWCARCGEQYPKATARYSASVDGNICSACFEATGGSRR